MMHLDGESAVPRDLRDLKSSPYDWSKVEQRLMRTWSLQVGSVDYSRISRLPLDRFVF